MTTSNTNIDDLIAKLQSSQEALGDGRSLRSPAEREAWHQRVRARADVVSGLLNLPDDAERAQRRVEDLEDRRTASLTKGAELEQQLADVPDPATIVDSRERDKEVERQRQLRQSLQLFHDGRLLSAPGVVWERVDDLDRKLHYARDRRDRVQAALDAHLKQAEQLLGEPVTS
jgi:hypothetical protein